MDPEEDMFFELFGACSVQLYGSMVWWPYLWSNLEGPWAMFTDVPKIIQ